MRIFSSLCLTFLLGYCLLFSLPVFAMYEDDLLTAINEGDIGVVDELLEAGANPEKIEGFSVLPSIEIAKHLLGNKEKPLLPDTLIYLILKQAVDDPVPEFSEIQLDQRDKLITLALVEGGDADKLLSIVTTRLLPVSSEDTKFLHLQRQESLIKIALEEARFPEAGYESMQFPTPVAATVMLKHSFRPNTFLKLILQQNCRKYNSKITGKITPQNWDAIDTRQSGVDDDLIAQRDGLVKLAFANGADDYEHLLTVLVNDMLPKNNSELNPIPPIKQQELIQLALKGGAKFSNVVLDLDNGLPSLEVARFLLGLGLDPTIVLNMAFRASCEKYNLKTKSYEISDELVKLRNELIELTLNSNADPNKIRHCSILPPVSVGNSLLEKNMDSNKFLNLILSCDNNDLKQAEKQKELVALAISNGASLDKIKNPEVLKSLRRDRVFFSQSQSALQKQLKNIIIKDKLDAADEDLATDARDDEKDIIDFIKKLKNNSGVCQGVTTLWLRSKWLQLTQQDADSYYSYNWFANITRSIFTPSIQKKLSYREFYDFMNYWTIIDFFQSPHDYIKGAGQLDVGRLMQLISLDTVGENLKRSYTIATTVTAAEQLCALLKEIVHEDELIYINFPHHATGLFKHGKDYYFYDPNSKMGEYRCSSIEEIAEIIFNNIDYSFICDKETYTLGSLVQQSQQNIGIVIYTFDGKKRCYPKQKDLLTKITSTLNHRQLLQAAFQAAQISCIKSLKFFLDHGVHLEEKLEVLNIGSISLRDYRKMCHDVGVELSEDTDDTDDIAEPEPQKEL